MMQEICAFDLGGRMHGYADANFARNVDTICLCVLCYMDADYARHTDTRRCTSSYVFTFVDV